jgi:hypothetical protein
MIEHSPTIKKDKIELGPQTIEHVPPQPGGSLIISQRHDNYDRKTGHLTEEGKKHAVETSRKTITDIIEQIPENERKDVQVIVIASPTRKNEGQRSMETADLVIKTTKEAFNKFGIPEENVLTDNPRPEENITEPKMMDSGKGLRRFLEEEYGEGLKFWKAYEEDVHKEERIKMGEEGPIEMSDRFAHFMNVLGRYSRYFHSKNKENPKRLILWNVSHYDTITTYFKNHVASIPQVEHVSVDYSGGISIVIDPENKTSITVNNKTYPVELTQQGTSLSRNNHS